MKIAHIILLFSTLFILSCGGGSNGGENPDPEPIPDPSASTLIFPENNKECTEGTVINETQSSVTFQWNASQNTDSYVLSITNLDTNTTSTKTAQTTSLAVTLQRGIPYEWYVTSKANGTTATGISSKFRFYNQGLGIKNYAPFPATAVSPKRGSTIATTTNVTLQWTGEDVDNDISSYEVFIGTTNNPTNSLGIVTTNTINSAVTSGTVYYWQVKTTDKEGNTSTSEVFEFKVG